jgi:serine/threonine protein kinase
MWQRHHDVVGIALGTPAYMAPEQAAASPNIDARADIYAWGIMAYELFAGRPPFSGRSPQAILAAQVSEAPEHVLKLRPALPPSLATLIMRCLEKHAADRPQTAGEIIHTDPDEHVDRDQPDGVTSSSHRRPKSVLATYRGSASMSCGSISPLAVRCQGVGSQAIAVPGGETL